MRRFQASSQVHPLDLQAPLTGQLVHGGCGDEKKLCPSSYCWTSSSSYHQLGSPCYWLIIQNQKNICLTFKTPFKPMSDWILGAPKKGILWRSRNLSTNIWGMTFHQGILNRMKPCRFIHGKHLSMVGHHEFGVGVVIDSHHVQSPSESIIILSSMKFGPEQNFGQPWQYWVVNWPYGDASTWKTRCENHLETHPPL